MLGSPIGPLATQTTLLKPSDQTATSGSADEPTSSSTQTSASSGTQSPPEAAPAPKETAPVRSSDASVQTQPAENRRIAGASAQSVVQAELARAEAPQKAASAEDEIAQARVAAEQYREQAIATALIERVSAPVQVAQVAAPKPDVPSADGGPYDTGSKAQTDPKAEPVKAKAEA